MKRQERVVQVPRYAFEALAAYTALGEDMVGVMLLLLMKMDKNRAVIIDTHLLPHYFTVRRDRLDYAISGVIKKGWIHSVDEEAMHDGFLNCIVHSAFTDSDFETLIALFNPRLPNTCKRM